MIAQWPFCVTMAVIRKLISNRPGLITLAARDEIANRRFMVEITSDHDESQSILSRTVKPYPCLEVAQQLRFRHILECDGGVIIKGDEYS